VEVQEIRTMTDHDYNFYPSSRFAQITQYTSPRAVPERVNAFSKLNAILFCIRYILAFRTEYHQNWLNYGVAKFAMRFINSSLLFGIRRNCLECGRSRS